MTKPIKVNQLMAYRVNRAHYDQDSRSNCLICNKTFQSCPHSFGQVSEVIAQVRTGIALGLLTTDKPAKEQK